MAYMSRLGLWGQGLTFRTFGEFIHAIENRGVGAMEMVAMDMKVSDFTSFLKNYNLLLASRSLPFASTFIYWRRFLSGRSPIVA